MNGDAESVSAVSQAMDCAGCGRDVMQFSRHYTHEDTGQLACPDCYDDKVKA